MECNKWILIGSNSIHKSLGPHFVSITVHKRPGPLNSQFKVPNTLKYHLNPRQVHYAVPNERSICKRRKRLADWIKRVNEDVDEEPEIEQIS